MQVKHNGKIENKENAQTLEEKILTAEDCPITLEEDEDFEPSFGEWEMISKQISYLNNIKREMIFDKKSVIGKGRYSNFDETNVFYLTCYGKVTFSDEATAEESLESIPSTFTYKRDGKVVEISYKMTPENAIDFTKSLYSVANKKYIEHYFYLWEDSVLSSYEEKKEYIESKDALYWLEKTLSMDFFTEPISRRNEENTKFYTEDEDSWDNYSYKNTYSYIKLD